MYIQASGRGIIGMVRVSIGALTADFIEVIFNGGKNMDKAFKSMYRMHTLAIPCLMDSTNANPTTGSG